MRLANRVFLFAFAVISSLLLPAYSCQAQNGPTQPSVTLVWTQSTSAGVTANCVYRGSAAGNYDMPAKFCSKTPITTFTDTTVVRGTTYHYAVTAQINAIEGGFSNDVAPTIGLAPAAPTLNAPETTKNIVPRAEPVLSARINWK